MGEGEGSEEEEEEDTASAKQGDDVPDEKPHEFIARVNLYVAVHLSRAPTSRRDDYKDGLVFQTRKELIQEFLRTTLSSKCHNNDCGW